MIDLRPLNRYCRKLGCRFETLKSLQYLSRPGDWAVSMDISDGFHCIEVAKEHRKYMTFNLMGCVMRHRVLPFGWTGSPHCFVKVMSVLTRLLRNPDMPARREDMNPSHWLRLRDMLLQR